MAVMNLLRKKVVTHTRDNLCFFFILFKYLFSCCYITLSVVQYSISRTSTVPVALGLCPLVYGQISAALM